MSSVDCDWSQGDQSEDTKRGVPILEHGVVQICSVSVLFQTLWRGGLQVEVAFVLEGGHHFAAVERIRASRMYSVLLL